jgi:enamine deaminase RidA (YjgF/YER057c/UK114 family)
MFLKQEKMIKVLNSVSLGPGKVQYAEGVRAGRWIFLTGAMASDFEKGVPLSVFNPSHPRFGKPKNEKEATYIFDRMRTLLRSNKSDMENVVRLDQYYTSWTAVDSYHTGRRKAFGQYIPPSTSILQKKLLLRDAEIEVEMIAIIPSREFSVQPVVLSEVDAPASSGYAPAVKVGDFIFIAGLIATKGKGKEEHVPSEAQIVPGYLWRGTQIKLETDYIISKRLIPALDRCGSCLSNVVKAQIHLRDRDDIPGFMEVWKKYFPVDPPVTTIIPTSNPGFAVEQAAIEITIIALSNEGKTRKEIISIPICTSFENQTLAIKAGDLLFITGLMATDENGLVKECVKNDKQPFFGSSIYCQMDNILGKAKRICEEAGTSLANTVRIQQYHENLNEFYEAYQTWQNYLPNQALPFSAVEVPSLAIPSCSVLLDLWVYAP